MEMHCNICNSQVSEIHYTPNQLLVINLKVIQVNTIVPMITVALDQLQTSK
jgi:hypothetical protein